MNYGAERIICLTEETTETLYLLGESDRIVGVSGFTVRPKQAKKEKAVISTFLDAKIDEIIELKPDLVIGFSDIQADIAQQLIKRGVSVWVNNYRSVDGILKMIVQLGSLVDKRNEAVRIAEQYHQKIQRIKKETALWKKRPKVYFEEWDDPMISGIQWVSELVEIAGGIDIYPEESRSSLAKGRIIKDGERTISHNPDIILASWCGKMYKPKRMFDRPGWKAINAYQNDFYREINSAIILQPGPAALTDGLDEIYEITSAWKEQHG